jgi:hypothetical protein
LQFCCNFVPASVQFCIGFQPSAVRVDEPSVSVSRGPIHDSVEAVYFSS